MSRPRFSGEAERRLRAELSNPDKPLRVSLTGHGSNNRVPVGRLWPGFGVVAFDSSTMVGLLLDAEDLGRAHRVGSRVMIDVPVESIEFLKLKVLEENQGRRKPMERIRAAWSGIWSTKRSWRGTLCVCLAFLSSNRFATSERKPFNVEVNQVNL